MIVAFGDVMCDVVALASGPLARGSDTPARVALRPGGSAANVAAWLGEDGVLVGRVGDDAFGRAALAGLAAPRVEVDRERPTGTCVVIVEPGGERSMLPDPGANDASASLPDDLLRAGSHLHVTGYALLREAARPGALDAIRRARAAGMTVSVDPSSAALIGAGSFDGLGIDLLLPNADEAAAITGSADPRHAARRLAGAVASEVVVKLGPAGALWTDGAEVVRVRAADVSVVDTTGAGDAFAAGLLAARACGEPPRAALDAACALAVRAVAHIGARPTDA